MKRAASLPSSIQTDPLWKLTCTCVPGAIHTLQPMHREGSARARAFPRSRSGSSAPRQVQIELSCGSVASLSRLSNRSKTRVLALINIVGYGMRGGPIEQDLSDMDSYLTAMRIVENKDVIVGIKTAHYNGPEWTPVVYMRRGISRSELVALYDATPERAMRQEVIGLLAQRTEPAATDKLIAIARSGHAISVLTRMAVPPDLHIVSAGLPPLPAEWPHNDGTGTSLTPAMNSLS